MSDAYKSAGYATDVLTGKVSKNGGLRVVTLGAGVGACFKVNGVDYAVTAGKTFYLTGFMILEQQVANALVVFRYADNAALTTNPVNLGISLPGCVLIAGNIPFIINVLPVSVPAGKYVGIFTTAGADIGVINVYVMGYEV